MNSRRVFLVVLTIVAAVSLAATALGQVYTQTPAVPIHKHSTHTRATQPVLANDSGTRSPLSLQPPTTITQLSDNIVEFYYVLKTGPGRYDQIGIHHVTLTDEYGNPVPSDDAIMMLHGDLWPFDGAFGREFTRQSIASYLASNKVDVWGIDLAWTLVPASENNFSFMQTWNLQHDVTDLETAITFARTFRAQNGSDGGPLTLLAWSRGGWHGYALLNQESQISCNQRQVKAFIPVDTYYKTDDPTIQSFLCSVEQSLDQLIANGIYNTDFTIYQTVGQYALQAPNVPSPAEICGDPFTNLTCAISVVAEYGDTFTPYYHFNAGYFPDGNYYSGVSNGLVYSNVNTINALFSGAGSYENLPMQADTMAITCGDDPNLPYDKHLADIKVPVHYVGAGGGFGPFGLYTLSLLGSENISHHIISFYPPDQAYKDFAHVDLFYAQDAQRLVWKDILDFVKEQRDTKCR
jgi:hypothetical protein